MGLNSNLFSEKVLFVCSGSRLGQCTAAIVEQSRALSVYGVNVSFFRVMGKGLAGYLKSIRQLRRHLKENRYYVVHAHYGLSGVVAFLAGARPLVVSLMGSDVFGPSWIFRLVKFFTVFVWPHTIVKSEAMASKLAPGKVKIIPNGVDFSLFKEIPREKARLKAGFKAPKHVLWPADPLRDVKNFGLARAAMDALQRRDCELTILKGKTRDEMPVFYNASDVVLVTSHWEGSPNVVKEALACNVPVVSTPVGDVRKWLLGVDGCRICNPEPEAVARGIEYALNYGTRIEGRQQINELDNEIVVKEILAVYEASIRSSSSR